MSPTPETEPADALALAGSLDADTLRRFMQALPVSVLVLSDDRRILQVNDAAARLVGAAGPVSLLGRDLLDFVPRDAHAQVLAYRASVLAGDEPAASQESWMRGLGGEAIPVEHAMLVGRHSGRPVLISVVRDLREVRRVEDALRESEQRLMDFAESGSDYFWELDRDLRLTFVSRRAGDATGVPWDELIGLTREEIFAQRLHPDDLADEERLKAHFAMLARREPYRDFEYRWRGNDGRYRTLRNSGKPIFDRHGQFAGYRGVGIDITERAATERALERERERFVRAERTARFGYWNWDCRSDEVTWSDGLYELLGQARDVDPGTGVALDAFHPADRETLRARLRSCLRDHRPFSVELRLGEDVTGHVRVTGECELGVAAEPRRLFGVVQDLTETRRVELLLKDVVDGMPAGVALFDSDDRLVMFNEAYREARDPETRAAIRVGASFDEVIRLGLRSGVSYDASGRALTLEERLAAHRSPNGPLLFQPGDDSRWIETVEHRARDGRTFVFRADVTERERLLRTLRENENRFRAITGATPYALCVATIDGGRILYANEAFERTFAIVDGLERHRTIEFYREPGERARLIERVRSGEVRSPEELTLRRASGESFWALVATVPIEFEGESSLLTSVIDITGRKESEAELARYRHHLEELVAERTHALEEAQSVMVRSERLAAIGQLTGTVAHELRNPLGTIQATFAAVRPRLRADEWTEARLDRIDRNIARCLLIIEELLDFARHRPLALCDTSIDDWCARVLADLQLPERAELSTDLQSGVTLPVDRDRLRQALVNGIENALQAIAEQPASRAGGLHLATCRVAGRVEIRLSDNGPGVPVELRAKVFEPLFSTKSFGIGLGLPLVRQIMEQHEGGVSITESESGGTTLVLWLRDPPQPDREA